MRAFIVGGSGQVGRAVAERLLRDGWEVVCAQRGEPLPHLRELGATSVHLDRKTDGALRAAIGEGADAVIDVVAFDETHARQLLELQDVVGQLNVISTASVYREDPERPVPIPESYLTVEPGAEDYSTKKAALEQTLLQESRVPVSLVRPCAIYGLNTKHAREWWYVKRFLDGRRHVPIKYPHSIFQTSATPNIAEVVRCALAASFHGVLNAGDPEPPSVREIGEIIAGATSWTGDFVDVPDDVAAVGETPWSAPGRFIVSMGAAERLGYSPQTSYAAYAPEVCRWIIEAAGGKDWLEVFPVLKYYGEMFDYAAEDAFLATCA